MVDWAERAVQVLKDLGGRERCVAGTKFRLALAKPGTTEGDEFREFLKNHEQTFTDFAAKLPDVVVHPQAGTDSFVGFRGASLPVPEEKTLFRDDVFEALTRATPTPYVYSPSTDRFSTTSDDPKQVALPRVTIEDLVQQRRRFIATVADDGVRGRLNESLDYAPNPLYAFSQQITQLRLGHRWHEFRYADLRERLRSWAQEHTLEFSPSWLDQHAAAPELGPDAILSQLAQFMTEEEVRGLPIPFRAVEAFYHALTRKPPRN